MAKYRVRAAKDLDGMIDPDITEIVNIDNPEEVFPTGRNEFRVGEVLEGDDIFFYETEMNHDLVWIAYSKNSWRIPKR